MIAAAFSSSSGGMFSAGSSRTRSFAVRQSTPFSMQVLTTSAALFSLGLMPIISPMPLTDSTPGAPVNRSKRYALFARTPASSASSMRLRTLTAPAQQTGFPPKVEPWSPGPKTSATYSPSSAQPSGSPPPRPFAVVTMSGWMP